MFNTIVLATDLSPASNALVECAIGLKTLGVKKVVLTYAMGLRHWHDMPSLTVAKVKPLLLEQKEQLMEQGLDVAIALVPGMPAAEIQRVAEQQYAALVAIAAHGESMVEDGLFNFVVPPGVRKIKFVPSQPTPDTGKEKGGKP